MYLENVGKQLSAKPGLPDMTAEESPQQPQESLSGKQTDSQKVPEQQQLAERRRALIEKIITEDAQLLKRLGR